MALLDFVRDIRVSRHQKGKTRKVVGCIYWTTPMKDHDTILLRNTNTTNTQPFYSSLHFVRDNLGELVQEEAFTPTHTYRGHQSSLICFLHRIWSMASSLFNLHAWQFISTISLQVFFGLATSTSYSIHFFTKSLSSFRSICRYHRKWDEVQTCIRPSRGQCHPLSLVPTNPDWFYLPGFYISGTCSPR